MKTAKRVNLLPVELLRRFEHRRQARRWIPIGAATVVLLGFGQFALDYRAGQAAAAHAELTVRTAQLLAVERQTQQLQQDAQRIRQTLQQRDALEQADVPLALLQIVASACKSRGGELRIDSYRMEESASAAAGVNRSTTPGKRIIVTGLANDALTVSRFVDALRASAALADVVLEASQAPDDQTATRTFHVRCDLAN
ncbi:MAG: hypothetical protein CMJ58_22820 [Planctomycetaceae bacterium]|nr:hypothetical protein [Planctomycetaceae bacterium]